MDQSLGYLREILSAHTEFDEVGKRLFDRISTYDYSTEGEFARNLNQEESNYLNQVLAEAIRYSNQEQNYERACQLNEVYELLFI
ncbi:sigma-G-dependent sporulation-specific acid-soluble spore protein CsgA [Metabacillus sp. RGM 3146]|uniref:sigma-G-dependent sporulation-specific acid-soluble spore protein CsgA n=1 Tax=Metabacillus sp. RGM 3146 TaxID=3401092 RepID=UPI003B9CF4FB